MQLKYLVVVFILLAMPWVLNFSKFVDCDFEPSYRCEVIHGVGVFMPPAAYITVWFDDDSDE